MNLIETKSVFVPVAAFHAKSISALDIRFANFARLCAAAAPKAGVYDVKGRAVRLQPGQLVATLEDLAKLWGVTKRSAERAIEAFTKDGLVDAYHVSHVPEILVRQDDGMPPGSLISIRNYRPT